MSVTIPTELDLPHGRCVLGGEPILYHCHHYNAFLLRSIRDASFIESPPFLIGAAAEVAHGQMSKLFQQQGLRDIGQRKQLAEEIYRWSGFGTIDLTRLTEAGGTLRTRNSHYAMAFRVRFGGSSEPVCYFTSGWLAGALAAIYDMPNGSFRATHPQCSAMGVSNECVFELAAGEPNYRVWTSVGVGQLNEYQPRFPPPPNLDSEGIIQALSQLPLVGDADGVINAFGVYVTHHYANYLNRLSFETVREAVAKFGEEGRQAAEPLLIDAGHACAFHTFGGIMSSTEWDAVIRPALKTKEDWVRGMVVAANAFGWGRWEVGKVSEEETEFTIHNDYESVGHLAMYGKADRNISLLFHGGVVGLMNLVYLGDIAQKPELTIGFYNHLFKKMKGYKAEALQCMAAGAPYTVFRVYRAD